MPVRTMGQCFQDNNSRAFGSSRSHDGTAVRTWFPDVEVGSASCYTREAFFEAEVFLRGGSERDVTSRQSPT